MKVFWWCWGICYRSDVLWSEKTCTDARFRRDQVSTRIGQSQIGSILHSDDLQVHLCES